MFDVGRFGLWVAGGWEGDAEGSLGFSAVLSGHATAGKVHRHFTGPKPAAA
jgi:hypothetical protein